MMKYVLYALVFIFPVIFIWAFFEYLPDYLPKILEGCFGVTDPNAENVKMQNFGLVGDSFGIYNALFSVLALYGVVLTLAYQSYSTKRASLIDRFYKMLDYHNAMVLELSVAKVEKPKTKDDIVIVKGRRVFVQHKIQIKYLLKVLGAYGGTIAPEEVYRVLLGSEKNAENYLDRPLSKLKKDIIRQAIKSYGLSIDIDNH